MRRLAIVVQRYGTDITGGAELHSRWVADKLRGRFRSTVFTTTALDYITWENHFPPGGHEIDGIEVRRFPIEARRDIDSFNTYSRWVFNEPHRDADEERWLRMQGPVSPGLIEAVRREKNNFDIFLFFTYLYYTTARGILEIGDKAVLLPTAHDEPALTLRLYEDVFAAPSGFLLNTKAEHDLIDRRFGLGHRPRSIVGMGVDLPGEMDVEATIKRFELPRPYALTFGRISYGKSHDLLFRHYPGDLTDLPLVAFGFTEMEIPEHPRIIYLGRVSDEERWALISAAAFTIHPSFYESLSLAVLESWAVGVPVLVNGDCKVLRDHVDTCGGGLYYRGGHVEFIERYVEFAGLSDSERKRMGEAGRDYVLSNYEANEVARRYGDFLERMIDYSN
jgi:glycosyltransferase involved in cell wall biosynthesis